VKSRQARTRYIEPRDLPSAFTDIVIGDLCNTAEIQDPVRRHRFGNAVRDAAEQFLEEVRRLQPSEIRREIAAFHRSIVSAQQKHERARLSDTRGALGEGVRNEVSIIVEKMRTMSRHTREILDESIRFGNRRSTLNSLVQRLKNPDSDRRAEALRLLDEACVAQIELVQGRRRPGGQRSRPHWALTFVGPPVRPAGRLANEAAYLLAWRLGVAFILATGRKPARWTELFQSPFVAVVSKVLSLVSRGHSEISAEGVVRRLDAWLERADLSVKSGRSSKSD